MIKKNITRKNISIKIYQNLGFSKNISAKIVDDFFEILSTELIKLNKIKISTFGTFGVLNKKRRMGRNPKTKIESDIRARRVINFKPAEIFKNKLNSK